MNEKVLIVDDQPGIRILLQEILQKEGYVTYQASNGKVALEMVREYLPHVVLLDIKIPGMDGIEILKRIMEINSNIKVLMMTAYGEPDLLQEALAVGAVEYLTKPFDIDELRATVQKYLPINS